MSVEDYKEEVNNAISHITCKLHVKKPGDFEIALGSILEHISQDIELRTTAAINAVIDGMNNNMNAGLLKQLGVILKKHLQILPDCINFAKIELRFQDLNIFLHFHCLTKIAYFLVTDLKHILALSMNDYISAGLASYQIRNTPFLDWNFNKCFDNQV